ncbi:MAG TPA: SDR family NAD(P)-dependent oxidoreductase [Polyangium sp.]|nr:SDR family NAD(P)-dependent oxidoreductase [Polyangium sp.]
MSNSTNALTMEQRMLLALKEARTKLETAERAQREPIAIIGMGCHFPGGANTPDAYWQLLSDGFDAIAPVPADRWSLEEFYDPDPTARGKTYLRAAGFIHQDLKSFDPSFFNISPPEAAAMDPQQRLLLEVSWEALENANVTPGELFGTQTGVFIGISTFDQAARLFGPSSLDDIDVYSSNGAAFSIAAGRLSYWLGLTGPSMCVDTACSSSLVALHLACQSLRQQECSVALAGGVNILLSPGLGIAFCKARMIAPDGHCKTFDAAANGFVRGEGCGMLVLKRLSDALAAGDEILALIRGSAVNHDGASGGLTVPSGPSQQAVIRRALSNAGIQPEQVGYVEAHGTGTSLGDPIEVGALGTVFQKRMDPLLIGSVKTNFGHLEAAAGVAGVMKAVLALQHGEIPRQLHFQTPNPHIPWNELPVKVAAETTQWPAHAPFAGVSSFGVSGTNAHVVLEPPPPRPTPSTGENALTDRPLHILTSSAKNEAALSVLAQRYRDCLSAKDAPALADICYTAAIKRNHFDHRLAVVGASREEVAEKLAAFHNGKSSDVHTGRIAPSRKIAFLFTGQGSQYVNMGRELYETEPAFRATLERCDEILRPHLGVSLLSVLFRDDVADGESKSNIHQTAFTQPALFAIEYALAQLWKSWGIHPDVVIGHSVGEYAAACVAGVFTLEEGLALIAARGRLMQELPAGGTMVAVQANESTVAAAISGTSVEIATINAPERVVIAGASESVQAAVALLHARDIKTRPLEVSHAFHSALMEPMLAAFGQTASRIAYQRPKIKFVSNLTGKTADAEVTSARYWRDHVRQAVRFAEGMATLDQLGVDTFIEIGPKPTLLGLGQLCLPGKTHTAWLPSLRSGQSDWRQLLESLSALYVRGAAIDWQGFERPYRTSCQTVTLPNYPFQRKRHWVEVPEGRALRATSSRQPSTTDHAHPFFKRQVHSPALGTGDKIFENEISLARVPYIAEHEFFDSIILPGVTYLEMVYTAAKSFFPGHLPIIENFVLPQALLLPNDTSIVTTLQLVCKPSANGGYTWHMYSADAQDPPGWTLHATGEIVHRPLLTAPSIDLLEVQGRCQKHDVRDIYRALATTGMNVGPTFENIVELYVGDGEALGRVCLPERLRREISAYTFVHFMLLDACLQVVQTLVPREDAHLPLGIDELHVHQPGRACTTLWSHVRYRSGQRETGSYRVDIQLFDEAGQIVATLVGVRFQRATKKTVRGASRRQDWLYQVEWNASPLAKVSPYAQSPGRWLILADQRGSGAELATQLQNRGEVCDVVCRPNGGADWNIDPTRDYRGVVYLQALDTLECDDVPRVVEDLCSDVLQLVQGIVKASNAPRLWIVTCDAIADTATRHVQVQQTPLWGLGRTIAWEHPELKCTCIDSAADTSPETLFATLWFADEENQLCLRDGMRRVARLEPYRSANAKLNIDAEGSYLITGGLGGLGLEVAKWLVAQGARHLVLSGRSGASSPAAQTALAALAESGARVQVVQADVAQLADVEQLIAICHANAPLRGIIHAAGVLDDGILLQQDRARMSKVLAPKVAGSWYLHRTTQHLPLDFFVNFSSMASLFGMPGQGNYAAANAFLDGLAHHRRAHGLPALSINWAGWAEVGMAAQAITTSRFMEGIAPDEGVQILGGLIAQDQARVGVLPVSWSQFAKEFPLSKAIPLFAHVLQKDALRATQDKTTSNELRQRLSNATVAERFELLESQIQNEIVQVLGRPLGDHDLFLDAGIDSLMSIQLSNRLAAKLELSLPATLLFDHATLAQLTDQLLQRMMAVRPTGMAKTNQEWLPLSYVQQQFILPESTIARSLVNVCSLYSLTGTLDAAALERACQALVVRHDALRLTVARRNGEWMQRVRPDARISLEIIDAPEWSRAELTEQVGIVWQRVFDLAEQLPVRAHLFRHAADQHTFALVYHHIVTDGFSHRLVSEELPLLYEAEVSGVPAKLPELPWSYVDHLKWEEAMLQGPEGVRLWQYWQAQLPNSLPVLDLPTDRPFPPAITHNGRDYVFQLAPDLAYLEDVCRREAVTPYTLILATFQLLLHGYSGQADIIVGAEVQNRIRAEQSKLVGSLADHGVSRSILNDEMTFPAYLQQVRNTVLGIFAHQGYPLLLLAERLGVKPKPGDAWVRQPLIQVVLNYLGSWGDSETPEEKPSAVQWNHLEIDWPHLGSWEDYFTLLVAEIPGDGLMGFAAYNTDVFDESTMARLMHDYRTLLAAIVANPAQSIAALLGQIGKTAPSPRHSS